VLQALYDFRTPSVLVDYHRAKINNKLAMKNRISFRVSEDLSKKISDAASKSAQSKSSFIRSCIQKDLAVSEFQSLRAQMMPIAVKSGFLTDEDVFKVVS
jgi:predicted transcriptional regulator